MIADDIKKVMGKGEKVAPVKSIKLKVKFDTKGARKVALNKMKK